MASMKAILDPRTYVPHHPGDPVTEKIRAGRSKGSQDINSKLFPYQSKGFEENKFFNPVRGFLTPKTSKPHPVPGRDVGEK